MSSKPTGSRWFHRARSLAGVVALAGTATLAFAVAPAGAASTVKAQLSLSGVATADSPIGGATVGIHPGDSLTLSASTVPTAGLQKLGLGDLLGGLLNNLVGYQVTADFSGLPGATAASKSTVLTGTKSATFTFAAKGTYNFTWSAQQVTLLGAVPITLDGNQLKAAGIALNAKNQYVGHVVVADNPPSGGLSLQLPTVSVQPQVGPITLPKISLPGLTTPTVPVTLPSVGSITGGGSGGTTAGGTTGVAGGSEHSVPIAALVVPSGDGLAYASGSGDTFTTDTSGSSATSGGAASFGTPATSGTSDATGAVSAAGKAAGAKTADTPVVAADSRVVTSSGIPVILAVVAVIALVLVSGTYARLFLIRVKDRD